MLSRAGQGLYWMSRYLVRGGHLCRLLASQYSVIHDRSVEDIDRSWRRIYDALGREPLGGSLQSSEGRERIMLADAYTLTDDLTFERQNPDSVLSCFAMARENARQHRNHISNEMWTCLNVAFLEMGDRQLIDIWDGDARAFFLSTSSATLAFSGWAARTMYRDDGWHFLQLGRFVERALLTIALAQAQVRLYPLADHSHALDWESLLYMCEACASYRRLHSIEYEPTRVLHFLVADAKLSNSVRHVLERASGTVTDLRSGGHAARSEDVSELIDQAVALLDEDWNERDPEDDQLTCNILGRIRSACLALHDQIELNYFHYAIEDATDP